MIVNNGHKWITLDDKLYIGINNVPKKVIAVYAGRTKVYPSGDVLVSYKFTAPDNSHSIIVTNVHRDTYAVYYNWQGYKELCFMSKGNEIFRYSDSASNQRIINVNGTDVYFSNIGLGGGANSNWPTYDNTDQYGYDPQLRLLWFEGGNATRERI